MKTIATGTVVFILWSALCTWYYLNYIKDFPAEDPASLEQTVTEGAQAPADSVPAAPQQEPSPSPPGPYTVYHEFDRSAIIPDPEFDTYIHQAAVYMEQMPGSRLDVTGHTDYVGPEEYNQKLGMRRAQSTKDYLTGSGISGGRIQISSEGESAPVASNETSEGRAKNRRTEIHINE